MDGENAAAAPLVIVAVSRRIHMGARDKMYSILYLPRDMAKKYRLDEQCEAICIDTGLGILIKRK
jgi:hypothetical protein